MVACAPCRIGVWETDLVLARSFLSRLAEPEREALLRIGIRRTFAAGAVLLFQDEQDDRVILILAGRVKVIRANKDSHELLLAIRDPGDLLGELAFIDGLPRVATVTALEEVEALVMTAGVLREHLRVEPRRRRRAARIRHRALSRRLGPADAVRGARHARAPVLADRRAGRPLRAARRRRRRGGDADLAGGARDMDRGLARRGGEGAADAARAGVAGNRQAPAGPRDAESLRGRAA